MINNIIYILIYLLYINIFIIYYIIYIIYYIHIYIIYIYIFRVPALKTTPNVNQQPGPAHMAHIAPGAFSGRAERNASAMSR
jgi:hypothetical protein